MPRGATLFSGGRGVELLLKNDIDFQFAVEFDPAIAAVGAQLGGHTIVSDVRLVDYSTWGALDYLHASPVCKNASQAKTDGEESATDIETAMSVVRCIEATEPSVFTLENVWGYRTFEAFQRICQALDRGGYMWHFEHLNAADFGVPQTRRRLILRASRGLLPTLPPAERWVGWYAAIEDLIPTLPESKFADWQLARLPEVLTTSLIDCTHRTDGDLTVRAFAEPSHTIASSHFRRPANEPRAFIVDGKPQNYAGALQLCDGDDRLVTVTASQTRHPFRAWLVGSQNAGQEYSDGLRNDEQPAMTMTARQHPRAWLNTGRVVKMTPRALARFQSVPDWYVLPEKNSLACTVIGNMVPPLMMSKIVKQLI